MTTIHEQHSDSNEASAQEVLDPRIQEILDWGAGHVPTIHELQDAFPYVQGSLAAMNGEAIDREGGHLDDAKVQTLLEKINPNTWRLTEDEVDFAARLADVRHPNSLSPEDRAIFDAFVAGLPDDAQQYSFRDRFKPYWKKRLELDEAIVDARSQAEEPNEGAEQVSVTPKTIAGAIKKAASSKKPRRTPKPATKPAAPQAEAGREPGKELIGPIDIVEGEIMPDAEAQEPIIEAPETISENGTELPGRKVHLAVEPPAKPASKEDEPGVKHPPTHDRGLADVEDDNEHETTKEPVSPSPFASVDNVESMFKYAIANHIVSEKRYHDMSIDELTQLLLSIEPAWTAAQVQQKETTDVPADTAAEQELAQGTEQEAFFPFPWPDELKPAYDFAQANDMVPEGKDFRTMELEEQVALLTSAAERMTAEAAGEAPVADVEAVQTEKGWKAHYADVKRWGRERLQALRGEARSHKKAIAATLVGVVALGTAVAGIRTIEDQAPKSATTQSKEVPATSPAHDKLIDMLRPTSANPDTTPAPVDTASTLDDHEAPGVLVNGQGPWTEVRDYLQSLGLENPTDAQIATVNNWTVKQNDIDVSSGQDHQLSVGTKLQLPTAAQVQELLNITL